METISKYLEGALVLIALYLIVTNWVGFSAAVNAGGGVVNQSFKVLQGRG